MNDIPFQIWYQGRWLPATFVFVTGAGSTSVFHIMVMNFYIGRLRFTGNWSFDGNRKMEDCGEDFSRFLSFLI